MTKVKEKKYGLFAIEREGGCFGADAWVGWFDSKKAVMDAIRRIALDEDRMESAYDIRFQVVNERIQILKSFDLDDFTMTVQRTALRLNVLEDLLEGLK